MRARTLATLDRRGFSLMELMIVVAIMLILMAIAIPGFLRARLTSNEVTAQGALRSTAQAQEQFRAAGLKDIDGDGDGEFGWFKDLGGQTGLLPAGASPYVNSILSQSAFTNGGLAQQSGYTFYMFLPTLDGPAEGEGTVAGDIEEAEEGLARENRFLVYAFPIELRGTGLRAYAINQSGRVFATANVDAQEYEGADRGGNLPNRGACLFRIPALGHPRNLDGILAPGVTAQDGFAWVPVDK